MSSKTMILALFALVATPTSGAKLRPATALNGEQMIISNPGECFRKAVTRRPFALTQLGKSMQKPGAGATGPGAGLGKVTPFERILKDGYMKTTCVKDSMYNFGDKFGDGKFAYNIGGSSNVSIVHYTDIVAKMDQKPMTITVCYDFCRTVPDMGFFGIFNGRDCYCTPYFKAMESDSSTCELPCDGDKAELCGGKHKSIIYEMHNCNDGAQVLGAAAVEANTAKAQLDELFPKAIKAANGKNELAAEFQKKMGLAGDPDASALMQVAKVSAGKLLHLAEDAEKQSKAMAGPIDKACQLTGLDLKKVDASGGEAEGENKGNLESLVSDLIPSDKVAQFMTFDVAKKGDELVKQMGKDTAAAEKVRAALQELYLLSEPMVSNAFFVKEGPCTTDADGCINSADGGGRYFNNENCLIDVVGDNVEMEVKRFETEGYCDHLTINGERYSGGDSEIKKVKTVSGQISWHTDGSVLRPGFTICGKSAKKDTENRGDQYYPAMYFVDKEYRELPMTCTGTVVGSPIYFKSYHSCAGACDEAVSSCVGFSYYPTGPGKPNLCFLFSDFTSATYYTGCDKDEKGSKFLQKQNETKIDQPLSDEPTFPVCVAKLDKFLGTTLKPDPSGKCKQCMKKLKQADRCYE